MYIFPSWFNEYDFNFCVPTKDGKKIVTEKQYDKILYSVCHSKKFISLNYLDNFIVSNILSYRYLLLINFLKLKQTNQKISWTCKEAEEMLKIKICDYDWKFNNISYEYNKTSEQLLFQPAKTFIEKLSYYKYKLLNTLNIFHTLKLDNNTLCPHCLVHHIGEMECFENKDKIIEYIMKLLDKTNDIKKIVYWTYVIESSDSKT